jgi:phage FluMu gp28-like protein
MVSESVAEALADAAELTDEGRFVLELLRRFDHPVLNYLFFQRLRPYQVAWILDFSPERIGLKGRRLGWTEADGIDTILTSSAFWEEFGAPVNEALERAGKPLIRWPKAHNTNVISRREKESKDYVRRCKRVLRALSTDCSADIGEDRDADFRRYFVLSRDNDLFFVFQHSGWMVQSETQSEGAGRGQEGHLKKDEAAHYKWARQIVASADKIPLSHPDLRISEFGTPQGTEGPGEVFYLKWSDTEKYKHYSRHRVDIWKAIEQGFPLTEAEARASCLDDDEFDEEFACKFVGSAYGYFTRDMLSAATAPAPPAAPSYTVVGIDVASEVDLTAVVVLRRYGTGSTWIGEHYAIRGVPYSTRDAREKFGAGVLGQEDIVAGLLWHLQPDAAIMDASADGAVLFGLLTSKEGLRNIVPHSFHSNGQAWKQTWVPLMRRGFESGSLYLSGARPKMYQSGLAEVVTRDTASDFVSLAFVEHHYDLMGHHLRQIQRKMLQSGITFESPRTRDGHGDLAWAALMGYSIAGNPQPRQHQSDYTKLLDAAMRGAPDAGVAGSDYAEFLG